MKRVLKTDMDYLRDEITLVKRRLNKLGDDLAHNEKYLKDLEEMLSKIEKDNEKPRMYYKDGSSLEITHYKKYSDKYIEFVLSSHRYRYIESYTTDDYNIFPIDDGGLKCTVIKNSKHIFEVYDCLVEKYVEVDYIDHIELLEGVSEYDKTNQKV